MMLLKGQSVYGGIAIGRIAFYENGRQAIERSLVANSQSELERLSQAIVIVLEQLQELYEKALAQAGEETAAIFQIHQMMLQDDDFQQAIRQLIIGEKVAATWAVTKAGERFGQTFAEMEDDYMKERAADVYDIANRLVAVLSGKNNDNTHFAHPSIIVAEDLSPSETVQMDKSKVLAFVTHKGSTNSHTAILARTMNIPALVNITEEITKELNGKMAIVDGFNATLYIEPDEETLLLFSDRQQKEREKNILLQQFKGKRAVTRDGKSIDLYANIASPDDVESALENDAEGIGLFRSEFLYLNSETFPTEEEQFIAYKKVVQAMGDKRVVIRTMDIGADKQAGYFGLEKEENPALGYRAIRICLTMPEIFKTQLRALFRASAFGKLAIMFPMIISVEEIIEIKNIILQVKSSLDAQGVAYSPNVEIGIMVETPAAVVIADLLAAQVDFFSIGTNDLTQYTLAIDRQNAKLGSFYNPHHPAIVRMIGHVVRFAHAAGIWVGICGELGADIAMAKTFIEMGVDELSVSASSILRLKKHIIEMDTAK